MDLIVLNGNVLPMTLANPREQAIHVQNGRIAKVGTNPQIERLKNTGTSVLDVKGKTVLPGFIDTHVHCTLTGLSMGCAQLGKAASVSEVCDIIHEQALKTPAGRWVYGMGCTPWALSEKRFPTMKELDRISEDHPIYIISATFHSGAANTAAFQLIDLDLSQEGIERDHSTGQPTGVFSTDDTHFAASRKALSNLSDEEIAALIRAAVNFAEGFTSLGFTIGIRRSRRTGREYPHIEPSKGGQQQIRSEVKRLTTEQYSAVPTEVVVRRVNQAARGWVGYFRYGNCRKALVILKRYLIYRMRIYQHRKHHYSSFGYKAYPDRYYFDSLGLYEVPTKAP